MFDVDHRQINHLVMLKNMRINDLVSMFNAIIGDDDMVKIPCFTPISLCDVESLDEILAWNNSDAMGWSALCLKEYYTPEI